MSDDASGAMWTRARLTEALERLTPTLRRDIHIERKWARLLDADDVLQVTFCEAFLSRDRIRAQSERELLGWLRAVAEHNLKDAIGAFSAARRPDAHTLVEPACAPADREAGFLEQLRVVTTTPSRIAMSREMREALHAAIAQLPDAYRAAIQGMLEGKEVAQHAAEMERSPGALHMLRARAEERLHLALRTHPALFP